MFDRQRRENPFWRWLKSWFTMTTRIKVGQIEVEKSALDRAAEFDRLAGLLDTLEREYKIGTVDAPAEYIKDTLPMFWRLIPSRPAYRRLKHDPGLLYFGGSTAHTVIALVGSPFHLIGRTRDITEEPSSDLPDLIAYLNRRFDELVDDDYKLADDDFGISAIDHADHMNKDPRIPVEFFAYRILDSADIQGFNPDRRLLLYSPLYVAYASDSHTIP